MVAIKQRVLSLILPLSFMIMVVPALAQDEEFKNMQQQFEKFSKNTAQEKIYVHTDKNFYLAGEIVWFKIYYVDAATNEPLDFSKVAYVEMVDRHNKPALQAKITLTEKGGAGSLYLPLTLNSDSYTMRAYTNWMKNSGSAIFFEKTISVVNTIKPVERTVQQDSIRILARFFPEGGNLVQGIETKVAFHIVGQNGKGVDAQGIITDDKGDTIKRFSTLKFGIGSFMFKPMAGNSYKATVTLPDGKSFTSSLPEVYEHGYVMNVTDNNDGRLKVRIQAKSKEVGQRGERVFLLAHTRQVLKTTEMGYINYENDLVFYIDKSKLAEGVSHFTLFNKDRQPVCERLIFSRSKTKVAMAVNSDKNNYAKREKVSLTISSGGDNKMIDHANYSMAVFRMDSLQIADENDITSYLLLTSDLRGEIESPGFYFTNEMGVEEATENLLMTHGWRRFRWENVLSATSVRPKFIPEYRGHLIAAKVTRTSDGKLAEDIECFLSFPGSPYGFYAARTDNNGMVYFDAKNYYGAGEIIVQASRDTTNNYRVDILNPFAEEYQKRNLPYIAITKKEEKNFVEKSIGMQAQNIYVADSIRRFDAPSLADTLPFFGKAEYSYRLDDYKRFTTMEEVLREYVTSINVALRNGKLYMTMWDDAAQTVYTDNILVLLDGVPLMNYHKIFSYDPLKLRRLDVVPRRYQIGGISFKGIASFETYQAKFDGFELTPGVVAVDYEGLQLQREFYSPTYATDADRQKRVPDFRSTLYWSPDVSIENPGKDTVEFYTSDQAGKYVVVLQGFNGNQPVSTIHSFTVK